MTQNSNNQEGKARWEIVAIARRLYEKDWLAASDGNISFRLDDNRILITPSGRPKGFINVHELAVMDLDGHVYSGNPSSERFMHLEVYREVPHARAVIHAHPPVATAWSIGRPDLKELPCKSCSELILAMGRVPIVPYARPGSVEMGKNLHPFLPKCKVMILSRHGSLTWGDDLEEAFWGTERLEHAARLLHYAESISPTHELHELPREEIRELELMREKIGDRIL